MSEVAQPLKTVFDDKQPILWIIPIGILSLITLLWAINLFTGFIPFYIQNILMTFSSALIGSAIAGYITETVKGRGKFAYFAMVTTLFLGAIIFVVTKGFLQHNIMGTTKKATFPLIGELLSNLTITVLPGAFTGSVIAGAVSLVPEEVVEEIEEGKYEPLQQKEIPRLTPENWPGYEKFCTRCNMSMPFDSLYCAHCGTMLKKRKLSSVKYCRYCGSRIYFIGEFCPDCGKEINLISKPKVYVSV